MTNYGPKEIASSFRTVRKNTVQVAEDIPEEKYSFRATPDTRTVAQTLAHVAMLPRFHREMAKATSMEAIDFPKVFAEMSAEEAKPRTKAELVKLLRESGEDFANWIETLREDFLAQVVTFPAGAQPATRTRFEMLLGVKEHEMHHRAQLMLIQRLLGIVPHLTRARLARQR